MGMFLKPHPKLCHEWFEGKMPEGWYSINPKVSMSGFINDLIKTFILIVKLIILFNYFVMVTNHHEMQKVE